MEFILTLVGLNHRTAGVDIREKFALTDHCSPDTWAIPRGGAARESLILSTCNRVEVIGVGEQSIEELILGHWATACNAPIGELRPHTYIYHGLSAVRHIFEVASSLDSMILGEPQILGQIKSAYRNAVKCNGAGAILNRLMHKTFSVAKRVRSETAIAASAVSISYAAVELAKRIFGHLPGHKAMLIGAGEMAELAATHLLQGGISELIIANRTFETGETLARRFQGRAVPFTDIYQEMVEADIVITSTGSREPIIDQENMSKVLRARKNRPMFLIDIAVPRDIDPAVNALDNIYLYDIDDLRDVVEENMAARKEEAQRAQLIIDEEVNYFGDWLESLSVKPTILDLLSRGDKFAQNEIEKTLKNLKNDSPELRSALEKMAHSLIAKLSHAPISYLTYGCAAQTDAQTRIANVRKIFDLDNDRRKR